MSYTTNGWQNFNLILASNSPRRKDLLHQAGYHFTVLPADVDEAHIIQELSANHKCRPQDIAGGLSKAKAEAVCHALSGKAAQGELLSDTFPNPSLTTKILAADTLVAYENEIFGKPKDEADAFRMLSALSGRIHQVYTGFTIITLEEKSCGSLILEQQITRTVATEVEFYPLSEEDIRWYISTGEPMDKAGSYGIQGLGARFVRGIHGDYNNVVGLPLAEVSRAF
jgi:septum formation protein